MMGEMMVMTLVVFFTSILFLNQANRNYQNSVEQLLNLNEFFRGLESLNNDVYVYTLEGDEEIFLEITDACMEGRRILAQMAEKKTVVISTGISVI